MTKAEQARRMAWRFEVLQQAAERSRHLAQTCRHFAISRQAFYRWKRDPDLKGKVERSHRVDDQDFCQLLDKGGVTDDIHLFNDKLRESEDYRESVQPESVT